MTEQIHVSAGLDLHKKFIIATLLTDTGFKEQRRFERTESGLFNLKEWTIEHKCEVVACESTSDFWVPIYTMMEGHVTVIVGNARDIKMYSHKKTDKVDSELIAQLALKGMIRPSRIFDRNHREFRSLARLRHKLVQKKPDIKNEIHHILDSELFRLSSVLTDLFGKSGLRILQGITNGSPMDEIIKKLPLNIRKKTVQLNEVLQTTISPEAILRLKYCLNLLKCLDNEIGNLTECIFQYSNEWFKQEMKILQSVPGIGKIAAVTLLAEIGNFSDFPSGDKLASWLGLVPNVYQSADKMRTGSITKRGSVHARWILVQIAHAASRKRNTVFQKFYDRKKPMIGAGKTIVALARKIATIVWHLITHNEFFDHRDGTAPLSSKLVKVRIPAIVSLDEILKILNRAAVVLKDPDPNIRGC
jgi:transposase